MTEISSRILALSLSLFGCGASDGTDMVSQSKPSCTDRTKNGKELGVDCGREACGVPCPDGQGCFVQFDCASHGACIDNICQAPSCTDRLWNREDETDIDCGGSICPKCSQNKTCLTNTDCQSNNCCDVGIGNFDKFVCCPKKN